MMAAYFDAGATRDGRVLCVGGWLLEHKQALKLNRKWARILDKAGLEVFHATDFHGGAPPYQLLSKEKRGLIYKQLVDLMMERPTIGIVTTLWEKEFNADAPPWWRRSNGGPYTLGALLCMHRVAWWAARNNYRGKIAYFFELGDSDGNIVEQAKRLLRNPAERIRYRLGSIEFIPKDECGSIQAADAVVWEWHKWYGEHNRGIPRVRISFKRLFGRDGPSVYVEFAEGEKLRRFFQAHTGHLPPVPGA